MCAIRGLDLTFHSDKKEKPGGKKSSKKKKIKTRQGLASLGWLASGRETGSERDGECAQGEKQPVRDGVDPLERRRRTRGLASSIDHSCGPDTIAPPHRGCFFFWLSASPRIFNGA